MQTHPDTWVIEIALQVLNVITANQDRYMQVTHLASTKAENSLESHPFVVCLVFLCRRKRKNVNVSEQAAILAGNIMQYSQNDKIVNFLTDRAEPLIKANQPVISTLFDDAEDSSISHYSDDCLCAGNCPAITFFCCFLFILGGFGYYLNI